MAAKNKLIDIESLAECWKILDREYGNSSEIRAKLKQSIAAIKPKATSTPLKEIELFEQVQTISAKIKAAGGSDNLSHDSEYIALVIRHLDSNQTKDWIDLDDESWTSFYNFLEKLAIKAK